jgi:hypothetical protein
VFFKYELSPYTVTYREDRKPVAHFIAAISSLIGGIYVVAGMVSSLSWYIDRVMKKPVRME